MIKTKGERPWEEKSLTYQNSCHWGMCLWSKLYKNGEPNNNEIIRRKKNTNMNKERRKLKAIINNHQGQNSKIQSTHLIIRTIISWKQNKYTPPILLQIK